MSSATRTWSESPGQGRRAVGEGRPTNRIRSRRAQAMGEGDRMTGPSRSVPRDGRIPAELRPRIGGGTPRAIARIEERAIGSACVVGKVLAVAADRRGSRRRRWVDHGFRRGSSCRGARCPFAHRTWRTAWMFSVRIHRIQPPVTSVRRQSGAVKTGCVQECVRLIPSTPALGGRDAHRGSGSSSPRCSRWEAPGARSGDRRWRRLPVSGCRAGGSAASRCHDRRGRQSRRRRTGSRP